MKELMSLGVAIVIFIAFNQQQTRYTQQSPEIETYKHRKQSYGYCRGKEVGRDKLGV